MKIALALIDVNIAWMYYDYIDKLEVGEELKMKRVIDAIVKKADKVCPSSLALIGVYGSILTGDTHKKSDLDLLILINDDCGWQLGECFIDEETKIGYDIYCTTWQGLEYDAQLVHPHISKLMESRIEYCADEKYMERLEELRNKVRNIQNSAFCLEDYKKLIPKIKNAKEHMANLFLSDALSEIRFEAAEIISELQDAVMLANKKYFKLGTKRTYDELNALEMLPDGFIENIDKVVKADNADEIKGEIKLLMQAVIAFLEKIKSETKKEPVTKENITGIYEEMYSNWKNKMNEAVKLDMPYLAYMNMISLQEMIDDIAGECAIERIDVLKHYNPKDLQSSRNGFDKVISEYLMEYQKVGLQVTTYKSIDDFLSVYLSDVSDDIGG